jgi:alkylhydroperoxidase/carboxymuconolactone decarboxylase family protein YurZ
LKPFSRPTPHNQILNRAALLRGGPVDDAAGRQPGCTALRAKAALGASPRLHTNSKGTNMRTNNIIAAAAAAAALTFASLAFAQQAPSVEETYKDIEANYGVLPEFMKVYPKQGIAGAWALTKALEIEKGALDPKIKSLINIAVALDTKFARQAGATDQEIAEAVAQAGLTRHWSAVLNGMQIDFEAFKAEFGGD